MATILSDEELNPSGLVGIRKFQNIWWLAPCLHQDIAMVSFDVELGPSSLTVATGIHGSRHSGLIKASPVVQAMSSPASCTCCHLVLRMLQAIDLQDKLILFLPYLDVAWISKSIA